MALSLFLLSGLTSKVYGASNSKNAVICNNLSVTPHSGYNPLTVTATISGRTLGGEKIISYKFDFGDGTGVVTSTGVTQTHVYPNAGSYTVKGYVVGKLTGEAGGTLNCVKTVNVEEGTIIVDKTSIVETLDKSDAQYGLVYGEGFNITSTGATGWQIHYNEPTQGQGFYDSSGGITPGSSYHVRSYLNASKPVGTYTGSAVVEYYKNGKWLPGPTVTYTLTLTDGPISVDRTSVNVTLSRANAEFGLIYGPGFTITRQGATGWMLYNNTVSQGQGFYDASGGILPNTSFNVRSYINPNKPNGVYTGSVTLHYEENGVWYASNTVISYTITLTD